jgi:guanine deaminase
LLSPIGDQDMLWMEDAAIAVDADGRLEAIGPWEAADDDRPGVVDLRPWVVMPGLVDLHAHLPQLPNAGVGAGLHLLDWLERYIFPL